MTRSKALTLEFTDTTINSGRARSRGPMLDGEIPDKISIRGSYRYIINRTGRNLETGQEWRSVCTDDCDEIIEGIINFIPRRQKNHRKGWNIL